MEQGCGGSVVGGLRHGNGVGGGTNIYSWPWGCPKEQACIQAVVHSAHLIVDVVVASCYVHNQERRHYVGGVGRGGNNVVVCEGYFGGCVRCATCKLNDSSS